MTDRFSRRLFIGTTAASLAATAWGVSPLRAAAQEPAMAGSDKRPNIIFLFSDEHRWCSLPFTEMPDLHAPNFTRFAGQGTNFDNCFSNNPVCVPYRATLITGMWSHQNTAVSNECFHNRNTIGIEAPTIAQTFSKAGYTTGYVGKWHLGDTCEQAGFDYFMHWRFGDDHWNTPWRDVIADQKAGRSPANPDWKHYKQYNPIGMSDHAIDFMRQNAGGDRPFLLMLSWNPPHWRWDDAPKESLDLYPNGKLSVRPNASPEMTNDLHYRNYHAHISAIDAEFGRFLKAIDDLGLSDDTLIIYTSDHGSSFSSNRHQSKVNPFDESIHVPFLVRWPGRVPAGRRSSTLLGTIDIYPTLCGLAGIQPPKHCGGRDLSNAIVGRDDQGPDAQFILCGANPNLYFRSLYNDPVGDSEVRPYRGFRTKRHTFVVRTDGDWLLYDNEADPYQMKNLVDDPASADLKEQLRKKLLEIMTVATDPWMPDQIRALPLPQRIAAEDAFYSHKRHEPALTELRDSILKDATAQAKADQRAALTAAADAALDETFRNRFGYLRMRLWSFQNEKNPGKWQALKREYDTLTAAAHNKVMAKALELN